MAAIAGRDLEDCTTTIKILAFFFPYWERFHNSVDTALALALGLCWGWLAWHSLAPQAFIFWSGVGACVGFLGSLAAECRGRSELAFLGFFVSAFYRCRSSR